MRCTGTGAAHFQADHGVASQQASSNCKRFESTSSRKDSKVPIS